MTPKGSRVPFLVPKVTHNVYRRKGFSQVTEGKRLRGVGVGARIQEKRAKLDRKGGGKLRQEDLAKLVGVTKRTVGAWERDARVPHGEHLVKLAQALGTTPEWVLYGERESRNGNEAETESPREQITRAIHLLFRALERLPPDAIPTVGGIPSPPGPVSPLSDEELEEARKAVKEATEPPDGEDEKPKSRPPRRKRRRG